MFALIDIVWFAGGVFLGARYKDYIIAAYEKAKALVAKVKGWL